MAALDKRWLYFLLIVAVIASLSKYSWLTNRQVLSVAIFAAIVAGSLLFWRFRLAFAFIGIVTLLAAGLLNIPHLLEYANFDIILFLVGMMIVIGFLEERHFFEIIVNKVVSLVGYNANRLILVLMLMSALFAALVDEVTSILFMTSTTVHLAGKYRVNPIPFIVMNVFATNIGSSATVVGNPVGVMIALQAHLSFGDFLRWASPISLAMLGIMIPPIMWYFRNNIRELSSNMKEQYQIQCETPTANPSFSQREFLISLAFFLGTISLLVCHSQIEGLLQLDKNSMLLGTALGAAGVALLLNRNKAREMIELRVDWWTLSFFLLFFASVGTLGYTGVTSFLALRLLFSAGLFNATGIFVSLTSVMAVLTAFMDNVLAIATFVPIILTLDSFGVFTFPLWWGALFGGTVFGNLTMIGSTANIVAVGVIERRKLGAVNFSWWIKPGLIASVPPLILAMLLLYLQFPLMPWW